MADNSAGFQRYSFNVAFHPLVHALTGRTQNACYPAGLKLSVNANIWHKHMIRHAEIGDLPIIKSFDPFSGDRNEDVEEKRVFVYLDGGLVCGYISMARGGLLGRPYIQYLAINGSFQRKGFGSKLLDYVEKTYRAERLFISTESENVGMQNLLAKRAYSSAGEISGANLNGTNELYFFKGPLPRKTSDPTS